LAISFAYIAIEDIQLLKLGCYDFSFNKIIGYGKNENGLIIRYQFIILLQIDKLTKLVISTVSPSKT